MADQQLRADFETVNTALTSAYTYPKKSRVSTLAEYEAAHKSLQEAMNALGRIKKVMESRGDSHSRRFPPSKS